MGNDTMEMGAASGADPVQTAARGPEPGGVDAGKGRPGRKTREEEVAAYLAEHGLTTVPGQSGPSAGPQVATGGDFNESRTRVGVELIVQAANSAAATFIEGQARAAVDTPEQAKAFGERARMADPTRETVIESAVELCKEKGLNIGPEYSLGAALIQWGLQLKALVADLKSVAALKAKMREGEPANGREGETAGAE